MPWLGGGFDITKSGGSASGSGSEVWSQSPLTSPRRSGKSSSNSLTELEQRLEGLQDAISRTPGFDSRAQPRLERLEKLARAELQLCCGILLAETYWDREGAPPDSQSQLVAIGGRALPIDPISGNPFVLRADNGPRGYLLYSIGFVGEDDGGRFVERMQYKSQLPKNVDYTISPIISNKP